jgi:predicted transcriptional regulator
MTIRYMANNSTPVSVRVKYTHLDALDNIAQALGINRSAAIQLAIAEFIKRKSR